MNKIKLIILTSIFFISCSDESKLNERSNSLKELSIQKQAELHDKVVYELIKIDKNTKKINFNNQIHLTLKTKFPNLYNEKTKKQIEYLLDNNFDKNKLNFSFNDFYLKARKKAIENGASKQIISFYDNACNNFNGNLSQRISNVKNKITDEKELKSIEVFNAIYKNSNILWNKNVPNKYLLSNVSKKGCDPSQQVILADAVAGGILSIIGGPIGPLGGGLASYLTREQQIQNNGKCID